MANKLLSEPLPDDVLMAHDEVFLSGQLKQLVQSVDPVLPIPRSNPARSPITSSPAVVPIVSLPSTSSGARSVPELDSVDGDWTKFPGIYDFFIEFSSATSKRKSWYYSEDNSTLFIKNETNFAVLFHMNCPSQANMSVRVMVRYSNPDEVERHCPVRPCSCNNHVNSRRQTYGDRFIISSAKHAKYAETMNGHKTVTVDLKNVPSMNGCHFAVYSYASYTSCLAKKSRVATIFSLMEGDKEVGRDVFYCRVCACPQRDLARRGKRTGEEGPQPKRRKFKSEPETLPLPPSSPPPTITPSPTQNPLPTLPPLPPIPPGLLYHDPDMDMTPDEDGYYTFTWKLKDQEMFHRLCDLKKHCIFLHRLRHLAH